MGHRRNSPSCKGMYGRAWRSSAYLKGPLKPNDGANLDESMEEIMQPHLIGYLSPPKTIELYRWYDTVHLQAPPRLPCKLDGSRSCRRFPSPPNSGRESLGKKVSHFSLREPIIQQLRSVAIHMQAPITMQHVLTVPEQSAPHKPLWLQFILISFEFQVNCPPVEEVKGSK